MTVTEVLTVTVLVATLWSEGGTMQRLRLRWRSITPNAASAITQLTTETLDASAAATLQSADAKTVYSLLESCLSEFSGTELCTAVAGRGTDPGTDTRFGAKTEGLELLERSAHSDGGGGRGQFLLAFAFRPAVNFAGVPLHQMQRQCFVSSKWSLAAIDLATTRQSANAQTAYPLMESLVQFWLELTVVELTI